jgi:GrpB-like predicted nucleotidyltransferase (UPF0157 family)/8-oxo-dGTP pyrophosphatase MutT (NUDIX family)
MIDTNVATSMPIGLQRGTVKLCDHDPEWETAAARTIAQLKIILGDTAVDIQHVGSTAIRSIKAKPIIDLAIAAVSTELIERLIPVLEQSGYIFRHRELNEDNLFFACGDYSKPDGIQECFIHMVTADSKAWKNYIRFRDYLNADSAAAKAYESVKAELASRYPADRKAYTAGKEEIISRILRKAQTRALFNTTVTVTIDRPAGTYHPRTNTIYYPINYGYIPDEIAPDGSGIDVYILGVSEPLTTFTGRVIGIVHRADDIEDKLVAAPEGMEFTQNEIAEAVHFVEKFYTYTVEAYYQKSSGMIVYRKTGGAPEYLVLYQQKSGTWSFPKGHMEAFETEEDTARREVREEIGLSPEPIPGFRAEVHYPVDGIRKTVAFRLAPIKGEPIPDRDEVGEYRWVDKAEAVSLIRNKDYMGILERAERVII